MSRLVPRIVPGDWQTVARAIARLDSKLNSSASPTFASVALTGLTASRLLSTSAASALASVANLAAWVAGTTDEIDVANDGDGTITLSLAAGVSGTIDHNSLLNTHNLTTSINHATITGAHNLTTDIDHDALTNFTSTEHFVQTAITNVSTALTTGLLKVTTTTGALSVVTDSSANWNTAYGWGNHASAGYAVAGGAFHDGFSDFVANEHIDWTGATQDFLTSGFGTINGLVPGTDALYDLGKEESVSGGYTLQDTQSATDTTTQNLLTSTWCGQTFTPTSNYSLAKVVFRLNTNVGNPTAVTLHLRATAAGLPTGEDIDSVVVDVTDLPGSPTLVDFIFTTPVALTLGTMYAIVLNVSAAAPTGSVMMRIGSPSGYTVGTVVSSTNSGSSWTSNASFDCVFYCYSSEDVTEYTRWQDLYLSGSLKDGTNSLTIANLQSAYAHIHNLTTDIDHDALTNFVANEHIDWTNATSALLTTGIATIGGAANAVQLIVKANASQAVANSLISLKNSAGAEIMRIHSDAVGSVFIGNNAGAVNTGAGNLFIGNQAGQDNTTGLSNVFIGNGAGGDNITGNYNFALGTDALRRATVATRNVAIGVAALDVATGSLEYNTAVGDRALRNTTGNNNTGVGSLAGYLQGTGANSVFIGYSAGYGSASYNASGCVMIGYQAGYNSIVSNRLYIENSNSATPLIYGEFDTDLVRINGTLDVNQKAYITSIGGYAVKLTNRTGANTVAGQLVRADTATNDGVILTAANEDECLGVFLDAGVANAAEAWVIVAGIADVAMQDNTAATRGNWVMASSEAGYADATNAATPGLLVAHMREIGHCIETVAATGAGTHILARCVLHFN